MNSDKLFPPQIEGVLPPYKYKDSILTIPCLMNKANNPSSIKGYALRVKSIHNNKLIYSTTNSESFGFQENLAAFNIPTDPNSIVFKPGVSYKIQIAYENTNGIIGYYSTVGIIKCVGNDYSINITNLDNEGSNIAKKEYQGLYTAPSDDQTETLYSYKFVIYDSDNNIIETSGELLHNNDSDGFDFYTAQRNLEENEMYHIIYYGTTINGLKVQSQKYYLKSMITVEGDLSAELIAVSNIEDGYIELSMIGKKDISNVEEVIDGLFVVCRSSSKDGFENWDDIYRFGLYSEPPSDFYFKDFTIEHGYNYKYSIQQYSKKNIYSNKIISNIVSASFEHSYLFDGERQLKIKFNPKVTSFKDTLLETKTNTLGGQFPFFYRNGNVSYKEFPISGLISYQMDENNYFLTDQDLYLDSNDYNRINTLKTGIKSSHSLYFENIEDYKQAYDLQQSYMQREKSNSQENKIKNGKFRTHNLTDYNILAERIFKTKVLEFLNDGKPKLFKSPTEGNFIVRLMNSSLAPNDQLGRMLHTFSTTATEVAPYNYRELGNYNITNVADFDKITDNVMQWKTYRLYDDIVKKGDNIDSDDFCSIGELGNLYSIQFLDMVPGERVLIKFEGEDEIEIRIGVTGAYYADFDKSPEYIKVHKNITRGQITLGYKGNVVTKFDTYEEIKIADMPIRQFIGAHSDYDDNYPGILSQLNNIKYQVQKYYFMNFTRRPYIEITEDEQDNLFIIDQQINNDPTNFLALEEDNKKYYLHINNDLYYYKLIRHNASDPIYFSADKPIKFVKPNENIDIYTISDEDINDCCYNDNEIKELYKIYIDDAEIDITQTGDFQLTKPDMGIPKLKFGYGIIADICVERREIVYEFEGNEEYIRKIQNNYDITENMINISTEYNTAKLNLEKLVNLKTIVNDSYQWSNTTKVDVEQLNYNYDVEFIKLKKAYDLAYDEYINNFITVALKNKGVINKYE